MQFLYLLFIMLGFNCVPAKHILGSFDQAFLPFLDLIGMNIELLSEFRQRKLAFQRIQSDFYFQC